MKRAGKIVVIKGGLLVSSAKGSLVVALLVSDSLASIAEIMEHAREYAKKPMLSRYMQRVGKYFGSLVEGNSKLTRESRAFPATSKVATCEMEVT